jgi:raffinose/stachyose/melibiose transport system substrate-binding protein/xylobiose transport system substrate-binding protein
MGMRQRTTILAAGLVLTVAACGNAGPQAAGGGGGEGTGNATVWALQDTTLNPIEKASTERFNGTGKGKASLQTFGNDPYKQKLRVALGSPQPPDVFFNWGGGNLKEYVDAGKVEDLSGMLNDNPQLKQSFIPSVLDAAKIDGKYYGIPMRGVQPVALFYNKKLFADAGVQPPKTWEDLLKLVDTFKGRGITPISLAGSQSWTELMYAEYLLDRRGGPEVFQAIRDGKPDAWKDPAVLQSMQDIRTLVDRGAFGTKYASVGYDVGGASTLLAQGRAAMHLMGSWEYVNQLGQSPDFVKSGGLGWTAFPTVTGGKGDPKNVVGNPTNFYSVASGSKAKQTAKDYVSTALNDPTYVDALVKAGDVPAVTGVESKLATADNADYTQWIYQQVKNAPSFQLSWDQDLPADQATRMLTELQKVFLGDQTPQGFVDAMAGS